MDWAGLMRLGFAEFRLSPAEFWALTPAEFLVMTQRAGKAAPMARQRLEALAARYPDKGAQDGGGI